MPDVIATFDVTETSSGKDLWRVILTAERIRFERSSDGHAIEFSRDEFHRGARVGGVFGLCAIAFVVEPKIGFRTDRATVVAIRSWAGRRSVDFIRFSKKYALIALLLGFMLIATSLLRMSRASAPDKGLSGDATVLAVAASIMALGLFSLLGLRPRYVLLHALVDGSIGVLALLAWMNGHTETSRVAVLVVGLALIATAVGRLFKFRRFVTNCAAGVDPPARALNPFEPRAKS